MTRETIAKFVDAFLADDAEECHKPEYENLAALVTMTYTESAWRTAMKRGAPELPMQDRVGGIHRGAVYGRECDGICQAVGHQWPLCDRYKQIFLHICASARCRGRKKDERRDVALAETVLR